jgi:hypothetical protein
MKCQLLFLLGVLIKISLSKSDDDQQTTKIEGELSVENQRDEAERTIRSQSHRKRSDQRLRSQLPEYHDRREGSSSAGAAESKGNQLQGDSQQEREVCENSWGEIDDEIEGQLNENRFPVVHRLNLVQGIRLEGLLLSVLQGPRWLDV